MTSRALARDLAPAVEMDEAATIVQQRTGLVFAGGRRVTLQHGVTKVMRAIGATTVAAFLARLESDRGVFDALVAEITVGETYFFREPQQWEFIKSVVVPDLRDRRTRRGRLRAWSAGTASGEEAYTLAIVLYEAGLLDDGCIMATDISEAALARAHRAQYGRWSLRGVDDDVVHRYFRRVGSRFDLAQQIRAGVDLRRLNLADARYPAFVAAGGDQGNDLILCRNVLIYFDAATSARVSRQLFWTLADGGWLFLGASDPLLSGDLPCDVIVTPGGLAYRRRTESSASPGPSVRAQVPEPFEGAATETVMEPAPPAAAAAPSVDPHSAETWAGIVRSLADSGELALSGTACARALADHPASPELLYLHALLLHQAGHHAEAVTAARRVLYMDRSVIVAHLLLGGALAVIGNREGAKRAFARAEGLLRHLAHDEPVFAAGGASAAQLTAIARLQLEQLGVC